MSVADQTIFTILPPRRDAAEAYKRLPALIVSMLAIWLGVNAIWGLTNSSDAVAILALLLAGSDHLILNHVRCSPLCGQLFSP